MKVLSCFDLSTIMVQPWAKKGYDCYCLDIEHPKGITKKAKNISLIGENILTSKFINELKDVHICFFFPPCTDVAVSGARWFKKKGLGKLIQALLLFKVSIDIAEKHAAPYMIENPVSTVSTYYRQPDYYFHPWMHGDLYTKKTCLWVGNNFVMPKPMHNKEPDNVNKTYIHKMWNIPGGQKQWANERSKTPAGFAKAVYEANKC